MGVQKLLNQLESCRNNKKLDLKKIDNFFIKLKFILDNTAQFYNSLICLENGELEGTVTKTHDQAFHISLHCLKKIEFVLNHINLNNPIDDIQFFKDLEQYKTIDSLKVISLETLIDIFNFNHKLMSNCKLRFEDTNLNFDNRYGENTNHFDEAKPLAPQFVKTSNMSDNINNLKIGNDLKINFRKMNADYFFDIKIRNLDPLLKPISLKPILKNIDNP